MLARYEELAALEARSDRGRLESGLAQVRASMLRSARSSHASNPSHALVRHRQSLRQPSPRCSIGRSRISIKSSTAKAMRQHDFSIAVCYSSSKHAPWP